MKKSFTLMYSFLMSKYSIRDKINYLRQIKKGKTQDFFSITDTSCETDILKFKNIKEYDYANYIFQKQHNTNIREEYNSLYLPGDWFRALPFDSLKEERTLLYGTLISFRSFFIDKVQEKIDDYIDTIIPNEYIYPYGQPLFVPTEDKKYFSMIDYEVRAGGREETLSSIKDFTFLMYKDIEEYAIKIADRFKEYTFIEESEEQELSSIYILTSIELAEKISFEDFFFKFREYQQPIGLVYNEVDSYFNNTIKKAIHNKIQEIEKLPTNIIEIR